MKILTWLNVTNDGAFQKPIGTNFYSDSMNVKPTFSFAFTDLQYIEQNNTFRVDAMLMTDAQKAEVLAYIDAVTPPFAWNVAVKTQEIESKHSQLSIAIVGQVSNTEIATWQDQRSEAYAYVANPLASTPMIDDLLIGRAIAGETKQILVDKIIANAVGYAQAYAPILGTYQGKMKQLAAATTAAQVDAIVW